MNKLDEMTLQEFDLISKMPFDLEITMRTYYQSRELLGKLNLPFCLAFKEKNINKVENYYTLLFDIITKLNAVLYHYKNYMEKEADLINKMIDKCQENGELVCKTPELLFEFEAFLFQIKCVLDLTVKVLYVLIPGHFGKTFKNKGKDLINQLNQYKEKKGVKVDLVNGLIEMITDEQKSWLNAAIGLRDQVAHYKTIIGYSYQIVDDNGKKIIDYPGIADVIIPEYIDIIYKNCIVFVQDFTSISIGLFFPEILSIAMNPLYDVNKENSIDKYLKYSINIITA